MNKNILNILFILDNLRTNKKGLMPIICRITFQQQRKNFNTGLFINPTHWHCKLQKANYEKLQNRIFI